MSDNRLPLQVKLIGIMQNGNQKIYMVSVVWSDQNNIIIYRTFDDFKQLNKELQRKFLTGSGLFRKSASNLPEFKDAPIKFKRKKGASKSMLRLKLLEKYSANLLNAEENVSQSEEVIQFFSAKMQDLEPSFPKNSIIIMPSEEDEEAGQDTKTHSPTITNPVTWEIYKCIEEYETKDTKNRPFKVNKGQTVEVLIKDNTGWWLVENEEKQLAWFPAPYLEKCSFTEVDGTENKQSEDEIYYAIKAYEAKNEDELSINIGVVVEVLEKSEDGYWLIYYNERNGYVPSMYLQPYKNPHMKLQVFHNNELSTSTPNLYRSASNTNLSKNPFKAGGTLEVDQFQPGNIKQARSLSCIANMDYDEKLRFPSTLSTSATSLDSENVCSRSSSNRSDSSEEFPNSPEHTRPTSNFLNVSSAHVAKRMPRSTPPQSPIKIIIESADEVSSPGCSDPLLFKPDEPIPSPPKMPPRPKPKEILTRCTTITKKAVQG
ncbi:NADPH oxidase organizer 1a [Latimeria chalumnae]|uniref:NADPH oxidase organizer 1a n=1 Tax=Latimeria chalumnae TaxID=7897 RepID=UPI0003C11B0D|nr:PREDICTED: NADPH oxidase organizer 1 [Latimeria chalumnae]|eukprot:XP_006013346.1 PREDICTED: NADPH oxidase organizer 1 [Latimeria chalumnae]